MYLKTEGKFEMKACVKYSRKECWKVIVLLIPFFKPVGIAYYSGLNRFFIAWKFVSMILILFEFFIIRGKVHIKYPKGYIGLGIFWLIYIVNNVINREWDSDVFNNAVISCFILFYAYELLLVGKMGEYIHGLATIFRWYYWIFVFSSILVRVGVLFFGSISGDYLYFLGTDNYSAFFLIPMLGIIFLDCCMNRMVKSLDFSICLYLGSYIIIYAWLRSMTALLAGMVVALLLFFYKYKAKVLQIVNVKTAIVFAIVVLVLIVGFHVQNLFSEFLIRVIGKGITLNSRTIIWQDALNLIKDTPWLGYGTLSDTFIASYKLYGANHAHNIFLELLLRTGIVGTMAFLSFLLYPAKTMIKMCRKKECGIIVIFFVGQIVLCTMDFYPTIQMLYCYMSIVYAFMRPALWMEDISNEKSRSCGSQL